MWGMRQVSCAATLPAGFASQGKVLHWLIVVGDQRPILRLAAGHLDVSEPSNPTSNLEQAITGVAVPAVKQLVCG